MKNFRIYPDWVTGGRLRWSIDEGDHRHQVRIDAFELRGCDARGEVDGRWTREEAREADAPKCWLQVTHAELHLFMLDGLLTAVLTLGTPGPVMP